MKNIAKQIFSFILPITVLILIPLSIENNIFLTNIPALFSGFLLMCLGLFIMIMNISLFNELLRSKLRSIFGNYFLLAASCGELTPKEIRIGKGTLAPWSPTEKLVIIGMYRYVRNPMIMGVLTVLIGESLAILSMKIFIWAVIFFIINNIYSTLYEEPNLEKRFGEEYQEYKRNFSRWIPRLKPYLPDSELK